MQRQLIVMILLLCACSPAFGALRTKEKAPAFTLKDQQGRERSLEEFLASGGTGTQGGVIVGYFASWCIECRRELPILDAQANELASKGIVIVLIAVREDFTRIAPLLRELKVDKPVVLIDPGGTATEHYQVRVLPTTFFIGKDGVVRDIIFGGIESKAELEKSVRALMR